MTTKTWLASIAGICCCWALQAQQGLIGEYYNGENFEEKIFTRSDARIHFVWNNVAPAPGMDPQAFSVRWKGRIKSPESGNFRFRAHVDDGIRVKVGNQMVINAWGMHDSEPFSGTVYMEAGRMYDLQVEYFNGLLEGEIQLYWQLPSEKPIFGGALGYNDKPIDSKYYFKPETAATAVPQSKPNVAAPKQQTPPKKTVTPARKPASVAQKPKPVVATPTPAPPKQTPISADTLEKYIPKNILFVQSKSIMLSESQPELDRLAGFLLRNPALKLNIDGHTDNHGDSAKNMILSEERTKVVAEYLAAKGVAAQRITTKGYGDTRPLANIATGNAKNRRVEFQVHY
jgi:outer membrane protein OmpA-like peptidoglycan-associated protein